MRLTVDAANHTIKHIKLHMLLKEPNMSRIISVQDIRQSLAMIANQAQAGETFVVVRNSRPVFKIVPADDVNIPGGIASPSLAEMTAKLDAVKASESFSSGELDMIIHEAHAEYGRK
jgi:prevent-host-death family protein